MTENVLLGSLCLLALIFLATPWIGLAIEKYWDWCESLKDRWFR